MMILALLLLLLQLPLECCVLLPLQGKSQNSNNSNNNNNKRRLMPLTAKNILQFYQNSNTKNPKIDHAFFFTNKNWNLLFYYYYYFKKIPKAKNIHTYPKTTIFPTSVNYTFLPEENVFFFTNFFG